MNNILFLNQIINKDKPIFISTGAASFSEIEKSVLFFKNHFFKDLIVLHCVSLYPTPWEKINLNRMIQIQKKFDVISGFSDHTIGTKASEYVSLLGGCVIEKHFTLDKNLPGPDHQLSVIPHELASIRKKIDVAFYMRKSSQKDSWLEEFTADYFGKRSLYKVDGKIIPMRPRQKGLPEDGEIL